MSSTDEARRLLAGAEGPMDDLDWRDFDDTWNEGAAALLAAAPRLLLDLADKLDAAEAEIARLRVVVDAVVLERETNDQYNEWRDDPANQVHHWSPTQQAEFDRLADASLAALWARDDVVAAFRALGAS